MKDLIQKILIFISVLISTRAEEVVYAQVGKTVTLTPPSNNPGQYMYWKFGKQDKIQIVWRNPFGGSGLGENIPGSKFSWSGNSLVIHSVSNENFGTYSYELSTNGKNVLSTVTFQLLKLTVETSARSPLLPGDSLSLSCKADAPQGKKAPQICWVNPQNKKLEMNKLSYMKSTNQHHGQWTCVVTTGEKEHNATVSVLVVDLSPAPSHPLYTSQLSPFTIPCSTHPGISWEHIRNKSINEVSWEFSHELPSGVISDNPEKIFSLSLENPMTWKELTARGLRPVSDLQKGNLSLNKRQAKEADRGNYTCKMKCKNGHTLTRTVRVEVLKITASPGTDLNAGQQLNLTCSLGHPLPSDMKLKWTSPDNSFHLSEKSEPNGSHLTFPEVGTGNNGKWGCALWQGDKQLTSDVITLKIKPRLSVWMLVTICSAAVIVILILLVVFIFYRRRQRKMRHLRHRLCKCKTPKPKGFYRT